MLAGKLLEQVSSAIFFNYHNQHNLYLAGKLVVRVCYSKAGAS
uniref:Uncharacterized protein n=1 Tax=Rhizophora mucronata TaxID=61149 RepID=A0A2P2QP34_RHIMU